MSTVQVRLYIGSHRGLEVWRSEGDIWSKVASPFEGQFVNCFGGSRRQPATVFSGVAHQGLFRTQDGGQSWTCVLEGDIRAVTVDPTDERVVYAGAEPVALHRSEDGGHTWQELTGLQALPEEVRKEWGFPVPPHLGHVLYIYLHPSDPRVLYLCIEQGGVVRSFDRGETWQDVSAGFVYSDLHRIAVLPGVEDVYFAATGRGFYRTDDPAKGWQRAEHGCAHDYFQDFVFLPGDSPIMLVAAAHGEPFDWNGPKGAQGAIYRSSDGAQHWERVGVGAGLSEDMQEMVWVLTPHPQDRATVFAGQGFLGRERPGIRAGVLVSHDRGDHWERLPLEPRALRALWATAD